MALRSFNPGAPLFAGSHFTWAEVHRKSGYPPGKLPYGPTTLGNGRIVLTPRKNAVMHARNLELLRAMVNAARLAKDLKPTGINLNSWARSYEHNLEVGGAGNSQHLYLLATDITLEEIDRLMPWKGGRVQFDKICDQLFKTGGFGTYPAGARHVDSRGSRARWSSWVPGV